MNLRLKLNLLIVVLTLGFFAALTWRLVANERSFIQEEIEAKHRLTVHMVERLAHTIRLFGLAPAVVESFLQSAGQIDANDIRFYSADGALRYTVPTPTSGPKRRAPEWFETVMQPNVEPTVIRMDGNRIEIIPDASRAILNAWDSITRVLLFGLAFVALLLGGLRLYLRRLLHPTEADARRLLATTQALDRSHEVTRLIQSSVEEERKRLARELHDELGQSVTAIRLIAASIARSNDTRVSASGAEKINEIAAGLYDGVHRIVRELRPAVLEQSDLAAALADLDREWRARHPDVALALALEGDLGDLGETLTLTVFRSVQEALTNVLKHAFAKRAWLTVMRRDGELQVRIEDDGRGAAEGLVSAGRGLLGMHERVAALGGTLETGTSAQGGFSIRIALPLPGDLE